VLLVFICQSHVNTRRLYCACIQAVSLSNAASGSQQAESGCQLSITRKAPGAEREDAIVRIASFCCS